MLQGTEVSKPPCKEKAHCYQATEANNEERIKKKRKGNIYLDLLNICFSVTDNSLRLMLKNSVSKQVMFANLHSSLLLKSLANPPLPDF